MYKLKMRKVPRAPDKKINATVEPGRALSEEQRNRVRPDQARCLLITVSANLENPLLSDSDFRLFVRNSLPATLGEADAK